MSPCGSPGPLLSTTVLLARETLIAFYPAVHPSPVNSAISSQGLLIPLNNAKLWTLLLQWKTGLYYSSGKQTVRGEGGLGLAKHRKLGDEKKTSSSGIAVTKSEFKF